MNWKHYFTSSIGKKLVMGFTGIFLIVFLIVHCYINALVFFMDGGVRFLEGAHFMGTNPVIRITEIGLFAGLILHIVQGLMLWSQNNSKRNTRYAVSAGNTTSKWYSRSMGLLGTLILLFLVMHLWHFWGPNRYSQTFHGEELNLFTGMQTVFANPIVVIVYVLGCGALMYHLIHGFYSAFQTMGLATSKYKGMIRSVGVWFSIIVCLVFALMPVSFYLGWIH
jgi:succinate dehydrogenase / fumarate reductase, cytochrome b subunit